MKKVALLLVVVLMSGLAMAQQSRGDKQKNMDPKAKAEQRTERMAKSLSLTDAQKQKVLELNIAEAQQLEANRPEKPAKDQQNTEAAKAERQKWQEKKQADKTAYNAKLKTILTPEQYTKYTEIQAKRDSTDNCKKDGKRQGGKDGKNKGGNKSK